MDGWVVGWSITSGDEGELLGGLEVIGLVPGGREELGGRLFCVGRLEDFAGGF